MSIIDLVIIGLIIIVPSFFYYQLLAYRKLNNNYFKETKELIATQRQCLEEMRSIRLEMRNFIFDLPVYEYLKTKYIEKEQELLTYKDALSNLKTNYETQQKYFNRLFRWIDWLDSKIKFN